MSSDAAVRPPFQLVESGEDLASAVRGWQDARALALDTEFVRERTFFHRLGLIQVADGQVADRGEPAVLIDPLAVRDITPLVPVLQDPATLKVLHSGSEDLEVFFRALGVVPSPLVDTQVAAALAGLGASLSYQKLVAATLGVELEKGETRTDWLARPFSPAQLAYAAEDVAYLLPVWERLREELLRLGRLEWALADSAALLDTSRFAEDSDSAYLRVKGAGRLKPRQLAALQRLAAWRDREARRRDLPRGFVLKDDLLLGLATRLPADDAELRKVPGFDPRQAARDGNVWLALVREALELPEAGLPEELDRMPYNPAVKELERKLRERVALCAAELQIPPEVLAPRRTLSAVLRIALTEPEPRLPRDLAGWRGEVVGEALLQEVRAAGRLV